MAPTLSSLAAAPTKLAARLLFCKNWRWTSSWVVPTWSTSTAAWSRRPRRFRSDIIVTGSGTYKVGGEVAFLQELALDLQLGGAHVEHFDSGLVPEAAPFPI